MWPAPAAPFEQAVTTLLSATNNTDGTYTLVFDAPITYANAPTPHTNPNWIVYSGLAQAWITVTASAAAIGNTLTVSIPGADGSGESFAILADWNRIHSANPIAVPVLVPTV